MARRPSTTTSSGLPAPLLATGVILVVVAAVVVLYSLKGDTRSAEATEKVEEVSPFADVPPEEPKKK